MEEVISTWLHASSDRDFLLVIAGRISGVHDEKGTHRPVAYQISGSIVIIQFDGSERLTISNATDSIMQPNSALVVRDASEARFGWYSHSDPQVDPKLCEEVFRKSGRLVEFSRTGAPFVTSGVLAYIGDQFIVLS